MSTRQRIWNRVSLPRIWLMLGILCCPLALVAWTKAGDQAPPGSREIAANADGRVIGDDACARCHERIFRSLDNPHVSQRHPTSGSLEVTCAVCHGPGEAHVQNDGDKSKILGSTAPTEEVDALCLKCHAGKHAIFERSAHGRNRVGCIRCHSIHASGDPKYLLSMAQPELCFQCHGNQRSQFSEPFRHKVMEGLIQCSDCHDPHGSFGENLQRLTAQQNFVCTKCHTEMAGPFEHEHAVVKTEGCIACHSPHGGPNAHMLNRAKVTTICLSCHFPTTMSSTGESLIQAHDAKGMGQPCTDCHADIHGSNVSPTFRRPE